MTLATKITVVRIFLIPFFVTFAILYSLSQQAGAADEALRWTALALFTLAALSDGIDGWIARRFHQQSELGAFLDPIADKALILAAIIILTLFQWGPDGWSIPYWFAALVIFRDCLILAGIRFLYSKKLKVAIKPHWTGKACTFSMFVVIAWIMLKAINLSPLFPCLIAAFLTLWSMLEYIRQGLGILRQSA